MNTNKHFLSYLAFNYFSNENVLDKGCRENQNNIFILKNVLFFKNRSVYEIMWKTMVDPGGPQMTI
jgi:hypothetical protein